VNVSPDSGARAARRGVLLAVLAGCSFVMPLSLFLLSPLLVNLTHEFNITVAQAGLLVTFTALPSALLALAMGPLSDFLGRRPLLVVGRWRERLSGELVCFCARAHLRADGG
jgi:predicted MFS family arabinose efflux permease